LRRKARRYQYGAYLKGIGTRFRGNVSVREIPFLLVKVDEDHATECRLRFRDRIDYSLVFHERASNGAEKSCRPRRRKRGLRRGKRRSRECHSRRSAPSTATVSKPPSSRKVNHQGRKFLWAVKASNRLRVDCKKYSKFLRPGVKLRMPAPWTPEGGPATVLTKIGRAEVRMKQHCLAKWTRLHKHAQSIGLHPTVAFHSSFEKYLGVETDVGKANAIADLFEIIGAVDTSSDPPEYYLTLVPDRRKKPSVRVCRMCGYVGSEAHAFGSCKTKCSICKALTSEDHQGNCRPLARGKKRPGQNRGKKRG